jgi:hypothetical protein
MPRALTRTSTQVSSRQPIGVRKSTEIYVAISTCSDNATKRPTQALRIAPLEATPIPVIKILPTRFLRRASSTTLLPRIVAGIQIFEAQRTNGCYWVTYSPDLAQWKWDVSPGRTMTLPADVEDARRDRINSVFRVFVRHQLHASGHLDPDHIGGGLRGMTDDHRKGGRKAEMPGTASSRRLRAGPI